MKTPVYLGAAAAALIAGPALADAELIFNVDGPGGNAVQYDMELDGALAGMNLAFDFTNAGGWTYAGDLLIGIIDPNGNGMEYGGFNLSYGLPSAGDFPSSFDVSSSGAFAINVSLAGMGLSGAGTWTVLLGDGYSGGEATDNWLGVMNLEGVEVIPAPGAFALLGLAGLAGRRRRR